MLFALYFCQKLREQIVLNSRLATLPDDPYMLKVAALKEKKSLTVQIQVDLYLAAYIISKDMHCNAGLNGVFHL